MAAYALVPNCTVDDAPGLAKNNMSAFWEETWWNMLWVDKSLDSIITAATTRMPMLLLTDRGVRRHQKVVSRATGEIVGYARWILPESHAGSWLEAQVPEASDMDKQVFEELYAGTVWNHRSDVDVDDPIHEMMRKHAPTRPYLKLDYLGVRPDHQRQGVASLLVKSGIQQADELGLDIFLVAMGVNAPGMYEKNGFHMLDQLSQDLKPWGTDEVYVTSVMVKHPAGA